MHAHGVWGQKKNKMKKKEFCCDGALGDLHITYTYIGGRPSRLKNFAM